MACCAFFVALSAHAQTASGVTGSPCSDPMATYEGLLRFTFCKRPLILTESDREEGSDDT